MTTVGFRELAEDIAAQNDISVRAATNILRGLPGIVLSHLGKGERVSLPGFLKLEVKHVPAKRKGELVRNPATGEMQRRLEPVAARFKVKASASTALGKNLPGANTAQGKRLVNALNSKE